jgi:beta-lactamase regulating signal transducer with metallopeptidase domain
MMPVQIPLSTNVFALLADPAVRALAFAAAMGLILAAFRVKATRHRLFAWTCVLYAALAMPLLGWLLPPVSIPVPSLLHAVVAQPSPAGNAFTAHTPAVHSESPAISSLPVPVAQDADEAPLPSPLRAAIRRNLSLAWIYLGITAALLARIAAGIGCARRLVKTSRPIHEVRVTQRLVAHAHACGLSFTPPALESEAIVVPITVGALRSAILFPAAWREWDDATLNAVIAHEISHVARGDTLTQLLSLLHSAIFWFSPLAWWLDAHLAGLFEQASDEAALSCGADSNDYAKTLLQFFEALHASSGRVRWQGVAMAKGKHVERRVERILAWKGMIMQQGRSSLKKSVAVAIIAMAVPAVYVAATAQPASPGLAAVAPSGVAGPTATMPVMATGRAAAALAMAAAPAMPAGGQSKSSRETISNNRTVYNYSNDDDDSDQRFVIVSQDSDRLIMSGMIEDAKHVEKLKKQISGDFIWFTRDEKSYVIRDKATLDRVKKLWAGEDELDKQQEELGRQQEVLGKQQEELSQKMEQVHVPLPDLTAELDHLRAKLKELGTSATADQVGDIQSEIGDLQSKIGDLQSTAGDEQSRVGDEMSKIGEKQSALGEKQSALGEKQSELASKATREMKQIFDEAIKNGTAQPEL